MPADPERQPFYCPYPGCKRKFASLWRLKVHYRAPPNERGSGKERGHGVELPVCPACGEELEPGKHHNKCKAGRTTNPPSKRVPKAGSTTTRTSRQAKASAASKKQSVRETRASNAVDTTSGNSYPDRVAYMPASSSMMPSLHETSMGEMPQASFVAPPGYQVFDCNSGMQRLHVLAPDGSRPCDSNEQQIQAGPAFLSMPNGGDACSEDMQLIQTNPDLSAQGAAEVLYTIAKGEVSPDEDEIAGQSAYMLGSLSDGQEGAAIPPMMVTGGKCLPGMVPADAVAGTPMTSEHFGGEVLDGAMGAVLDGEDTADGVPVDALGAGVPMMVPWGDQAGNAMVQMVMTPHGMMPVMHSNQQVLFPLQTMKGPDGEEVTVAMAGMPPGAVLLAPEHGSAGAPLMMNADGTGFVLAGEGGEYSMPILHVAEDGSMPCALSIGQPPAECGPNGRISEEAFMNAMRMASAAELSATS